MLCHLVSSLEVLLSLEGEGETRGEAGEAHSQDWGGGGGVGRENGYHDCWPNSLEPKLCAIGGRGIVMCSQ